MFAGARTRGGAATRLAPGLRTVARSAGCTLAKQAMFSPRNSVALPIGERTRDLCSTTSGPRRATRAGLAGRNGEWYISQWARRMAQDLERRYVDSPCTTTMSHAVDRSDRHTIDAGDAVLLPHLPEERRTVAFAIKDDQEAAEMRSAASLCIWASTDAVRTMWKRKVPPYGPSRSLWWR